MKIGIFDSGLGGLFVAKEIIRKLPRYDYSYLGDTAHLPYGTRSQKEIYDLTARAVTYLFKQNCAVVILACNTASSQALRKLQREFLPKHFPGRRILGVIIPSAEAAVGQSAEDQRAAPQRRRPQRIGIMATPATVASKTYVKEIRSLAPRAQVYQQAAPLLVPMIESKGWRGIDPALKSYLKPLLARKIATLILGCTHYGILKPKVRRLVGPKVKIISQNDVVAEKFAIYLQRHPEIAKRLSKNSKRTFSVTMLNKNFARAAKIWFGKPVPLRLVKY